MSILKILVWPDTRLRNHAKPVKTVDKTITQICDDMLETMYDAPGVGLAAIQVNIAKRIIVIDVSEEKNEPYCFINPKITESIGTDLMQEGCLSIPGYYEDIERAKTVTVEALDKEGQSFELQAEGLLSVCIQHEIDHLDGKLFVDYLSPLKRQRIRKKLEKEARKK